MEDLTKQLSDLKTGGKVLSPDKAKEYFDKMESTDKQKSRQSAHDQSKSLSMNMQQREQGFHSDQNVVTYGINSVTNKISGKKTNKFQSDVDQSDNLEDDIDSKDQPLSDTEADAKSSDSSWFDEEQPELMTQHDSEDEKWAPFTNTQRCYDVYKFAGVILYQISLFMFLTYYFSSNFASKHLLNMFFLFLLLRPCMIVFYTTTTSILNLHSAQYRRNQIKIRKINEIIVEEEWIKDKKKADPDGSDDEHKVIENIPQPSRQLEAVNLPENETDEQEEFADFEEENNQGAGWRRKMTMDQ